MNWRGNREGGTHRVGETCARGGSVFSRFAVMDAGRYFLGTFAHVTLGWRESLSHYRVILLPVSSQVNSGPSGSRDIPPKDPKKKIWPLCLSWSQIVCSSCHSPPLCLLLPYICPSPSPLPPPSFLSLPFARSQTAAQIYRRWRDASGGQTHERLPVCLPYHSLWLI